MKFLSFFAISKPSDKLLPKRQAEKLYRKMRWQIFFAATIGYGLFYVCRLSLNVVKKPLVDAGYMSEAELGIIGSGLFVTYAVGKFVNGFLADRSNIRFFMSVGLLISALVNFALGFHMSFAAFVILWAVNGWSQSMGAAPCVVALSRWYRNSERGTFYGFWSSSHNIGEALTFLVISLVTVNLGWQWGFRWAAILGLVGVACVFLLMRDTPESLGLLSPSRTAVASMPNTKENIGASQRAVLRNPAVWVLALSSAFMYITRYAVNSWGIFFLEANKGYSTVEASAIVSVSSICGIIGTVSSGWISDRLFHGRRNIPALIFGLMNIVGLCMFLLFPRGNYVMDVLSMVVFGLAIGALICFLGGLMAVDIAPKCASGAALGVVGIASYMGSALQELISGLMIGSNKQVAEGISTYDFSYVIWFWIGSAVLSVICTLCLWNVRAHD